MAISKANLAKIHIAKKELGLSDEDYRDILGLHFQVQSAKSLNDRQAAVLLNRFRVHGWQPKASAAGKKSTGSPKYKEGYKRKIVALWITLHQKGVIRNGSDQALQAYVKGRTGRENLRFCDESDCYPVIESLKAIAERHGVDLVR